MFGDLGLRPEMLVDLAINLANIVIMFLIVRFLVYKPVRKFMNARAQKAENEKKEIDAKLEEARQLKEEYTQKLQQTEEAANKLIADANAEAESNAAVILNKAHRDAGAIIEEAKKEAQQTVPLRSFFLFLNFKKKVAVGRHGPFFFVNNHLQLIQIYTIWNPTIFHFLDQFFLIHPHNLFDFFFL